MAKCRGCGQEITWIKMKTGKSMPVDPELDIQTVEFLGNEDRGGFGSTGRR